MTIMCPAEFASAAKFAAGADDALEAAIATAEDPERRKTLERKRGQATRTLLACFGQRALCDDVDNKAEGRFPKGSEVRYPDGTVATICSLGAYDRPIRETFVFADMARHSFFFREEWIDPSKRQRVEIFDRCWYIFRDGKTQEEVDSLSDEELDEEYRNGDGKVERTFFAEAAEAIKAGDAHVPVAETMRKRTGMCGGIIYHPDWDGGKASPYGSWSTHT